MYLPPRRCVSHLSKGARERYEDEGWRCDRGGRDRPIEIIRYGLRLSIPFIQVPLGSTLLER